jgi:predicted tellurium resistance membrane protein TerC
MDLSFLNDSNFWARLLPIVLIILVLAGGNALVIALVLFGLFLSIPLVTWGSGLLAQLMNRFRSIIWTGGGVLGYVAGDMILRDLWMITQMGPSLAAAYRYAVLTLGLAVAILGWRTGRRNLQTAN